MQNLEFPEIARLLKKHLKERGITYRDLAKKLRLSESNVKKIFIAEDCSLARLNSICAAIGIPLPAIMEEASHRKFELLAFTMAQEKFLVQNRAAFRVYWKLAYEKRSQAEIKKQLGLDEASLFKALRALDGQGLIELLPEGKARFPNTEMLLWDSKGPLIELVKQEWAPLLLQKISKGLGSKGFSLGLSYFNLKPESAEEMKVAVSALFEEFARRSIRETNSSPDKVAPLVILQGFSPSAFVEML